MKLLLPFIMVKQTHFIPLKLERNKKILVRQSYKKRRNGRYLLEGGITLGILQPYYIKVATLNEDTGLPELKEIKYGAGSDDLFLDNSRIFGRASLSKGLFESTFIPGIHLQFTTF
jgi:hypothetical protein